MSIDFKFKKGALLLDERRNEIVLVITNPFDPWESLKNKNNTQLLPNCVCVWIMYPSMRTYWINININIQGYSVINT